MRSLLSFFFFFIIIIISSLLVFDRCRFLIDFSASFVGVYLRQAHLFSMTVNREGGPFFWYFLTCDVGSN